MDENAEGHQATWAADEPSLELTIAAVSDAVDDDAEHIANTALQDNGLLDFGTARQTLYESSPPSDDDASLSSLALTWALRNSSGVNKGLVKSVVQGGREFRHIGAGCGQ